MRTLDTFTNVYPISKTLRFELKPIGRTLEYIQEQGLLNHDEHRAESYKIVKNIIDKYHKVFIESALDDFALILEDSGKMDSLQEYFYYYMQKSKDESIVKNFDKVKDNLRKQIVKKFKSDSRFKILDKKELIKEELSVFVSTDEERLLVGEFSDFTSYFTGFHENRKNMYSDEAKSTAIAYRLIHENLPRFIDNISIFEKIQNSAIKNYFGEIYSELESCLNVLSIDELFKLEYYSNVLTQTQIDVYNAVIGGNTNADGKKNKGLNEYINLYNQQQKDKSLRLPKLKVLYKQILSDRNAISWLPEQFNNDNEVLESIHKAYQELDRYVLNKKDKGEHSLKELLQSLNHYELDKIYIRNDQQMTDLSQKLYGHWSIISKALIEELKKEMSKKKSEKDNVYEERLGKTLKLLGSVSIGQINKSVKGLNIENSCDIQTYFANLGATSTDRLHKENLFEQIEKEYNEIKDLLNTPYPAHKNLVQDKESVEKIKTFLDAIKELQHFVKPLLGDGTESEKDEKFYGEFIALWETLNDFTLLYNKVRNYVTRKPYSTEKIKLNFENPTLLNGWDLNKETDNSCVILRKDGMYYLAIMNKKHNKVFKDFPSKGECYEKIDYKLLPGANKMLPKVFFSKSRIDEFAPSEELLNNYNKETHKKGGNFNINDCHALIDFFKASINKHEDWKNFNFKFSETYTYEDLSGFYREVEHQGYKISFRQISMSYIDELVEDGKIYLFQIYNKDFSPYSKGKPNLHTLYWKMLFDDHNLADVVYKLNGEAEVFYRKSSIKCESPTHPADQPINNKNALNIKKQSTFSYDLIKDKRYTVDKFMFHVPITMNFKGTGNENINVKVNEFIKEFEDLHIIGIDRGERHLLYLTLINSKGEILKQYSLNEIVNQYKGVECRTNYHDLLAQREEERMQSRKSWQAIENIKELKEGYLSQVVHIISQLMVQYNAIVVLEDLNIGFKRGRQKVELSVYQQFEKMLIDKLNYLVDKNTLANNPGGLLRAYQLTGKFTSFKKMGKQCGFLFYIPAWNTSKMDPVTGFVNLLDTRYENVEKSKSFFGKFDSIRYNKEKDWFEFKLDYNNFTSKAEGTRTKWTVCTYGKRIWTHRVAENNNQFVSEEIDLTAKFIELFKNYGIDVKGDLKELIKKQSSKEFFIDLLHLLKLTLQMRNSVTGSEVDYLQSPVSDENGVFYNSENANESLPENADANGAYNIARKGLWVINQIKQASDLKKIDLAISNKEWLKFAQEKPYLKD